MDEMNTAIAKNEAGRDLRLDLFRGLANWAIFLDHIPNNVVAWITMKNYGFSDAADLFVFISGYTVALVYSRTMGADGFVWPRSAFLLGLGSYTSRIYCCSLFMSSRSATWPRTTATPICSTNLTSGV